MASVKEQLQVLTAGTVDCIEPEELEAKLRLRRPLQVKLGIDPTASDIHLGFAVVLRKLRQFQDFGHKAVLIVGDFTAQIGDPSGISKTRRQLGKQTVERHARTYLRQVKKILRPDRDLLGVRRNSQWLARIDMTEMLYLTRHVTVAQLLQRADFSQRMAQERPISFTELLYPVMQAYDSVRVESDVELGGTDQLFNNLLGRELQRAAKQKPQVVLTTPLLKGLDGEQKMSKSLGNYIGITERPTQQFGKLMKVPDHLMPRYFELTTGWHPDQVAHVTHQLETGDLHPAEAKRLLARTVVALYHSPKAAARAETEFDRVFKHGDAPSRVKELAIPPEQLRDGRIEVARLLALAKLVGSNREGRRKIAEGGVYLDDERVTDPQLEVSPTEVDGRFLRLGRRSWVRIRAT